MEGISCELTGRPVPIEAAHTGVSEGKAATQSGTYMPRSRSAANAGARPSVIARSSISGLSASITPSTSFLG